MVAKTISSTYSSGVTLSSAAKLTPVPATVTALYGVILSAVSGTYATGVTLSVNPTTIASTASIDNGGTGPAVFGGGSYTVVNYGKVTSSGTGTSVGNPGIYLSGDGSTLDNRGTITAAGNAADLYGSGSLINSGILSAGHWGLTSRGLFTVTNTGSISGASNGIVLFAGGFISNSDQITGTDGLRITGAAGAVINSGTINATYGIAIDIASGGTVSNTGSGLISAAGYYAAISIAGGAGTVVNAGHIIADAAGVYLGAGGSVTNQSGGNIGGNANLRGAAGVYLAAGGSVTNQSGGTISGYYGVRASGAPATVVNAGVIAGNYASNYQRADGVYLSAGGAVTNQASGIIYARSDSVLITGGRGTVVNLGTIHSHIGGYGGRGVSLDAGGVIINGASGGTASSATILGYNYAIQFGTTGTDTLMNYGTVYGPTGTVAVAMYTGTVINGASGATGALIKSGLGATAVRIAGVGTVVNYGTINGNAVNGSSRVVYGVSIGGNGSLASTISNLGTAAVIQGYVAVYAAQNATVTNAGTIAVYQTFGGSIPLYAVIFGGGTNRLIIDPGAVFSGNVNGSGPVTVAPGGNTIVLGTAIGTTTLELASAAMAGTLSGLGTNYVGFAAVTIDSATNWTFSGSNTLASGVTLVDSGALTDSGTFTNAGLVTGSAKGVVLAASARITNQSGGTIAGSSIGVSASGAGTVVNAGVIGGNQTVTTASGISFAAGGSVTNQSGGTIRGARAISELTGTLSVLNAGSITGGSGAGRSGIALHGSGTISNQSSGVITGNYGIVAYVSGTTVTNAGSISGVYGVLLNAAGKVTNLSGGFISGSSEGVLFNAATTMTNAGTISGVGYGVQLAAGGTLIAQSGGIISSAGTAVSFAASRTNRLVVYQGASFTGRVDGGNTIGAASISTLKLASSASAGTLNGLGSQFTHFAQVTIDAGAQWVLGGTQSGFATLTNAGRLGGTSGYGIKVGTSATSVTIVNQSAGVITGTTDAVFVITGSGAGTVTNSGKITGGATGFAGINLSGGGRVSNASGGTITGLQAGVFIANGSGATVSNAGSIGASQSYGVWLLNAGTVTNASGGVIKGGYATADAAGVYLGGGGAVTNQSGGTVGGLRGIYVLSSAATVVNAGRIVGSNTTIGAGAANTGAGVYLGAGGLVTNQSGGTISGYIGVRVSGAAGTVVNAGIIIATPTLGNAVGVLLSAGGSVTNQSTGTITAYSGIEIQGAAGTVVNAGIIIAATTLGNAVGVLLSAGGSVTNQSTGTITAYSGIEIQGTAGTVLNLGHIVSRDDLDGSNGVYLQNGGTVTNGTAGGTASTASILGYSGAVRFGASGTLINYGTLDGHPGHPAVIMATGTVVNGRGAATGALIEGGEAASDVLISGAGAVTNYATIVSVEPTQFSGGIAFGISLGGVGTISNLGSLSLIETYLPIYTAQGATVINAGTIRSQYGAGKGAFAVVFGGGTNRLIIDPGARFYGIVSGSSDPITLASGNTNGSASVIATAAGTSTLELSTGASAGALTSLGSGYVGFQNITVDALAAWTLYAANLGSGYTLNDAGTLTNTGTLNSAVTLGTGAQLTNASAGVISVSGTAVIAAAGTATVVNAGHITGASAGGVGVYLATGGLVSNQSGSTIFGSVDGIDAANGTVLNDGSIASGGAGIGGFGIYFAGSGTIVNAAGATIYGYQGNIQVNGADALVTNLGKIADPNGIFSGSGVSLNNGGTIINGAPGTTHSTASISGYSYGVRFGYGSNPSTLGNYGTITDEAGGKAVLMENGVVFNGRSGATSALLDAGGGAAVWFRYAGSSGTVVNYATISAHGAYRYQGVSFQGAGTVSNLGPSALIKGYIGVVGLNDDTVINAGTIASYLGSGPHAYAVVLVGGTNRLRMYPGAKFIGTVSGGGPVTLLGGSYVLGSVTASTSTLELASASAIGTLSGLGTAFVNFANATIDHAAQWLLAGRNTLGSGATVTNAGTLIDAGTFSNAGRIVGTLGSIIGGGTIAISVASGGILSNSATGAITGAAGIDSNVGAGGPGGYGVSLTAGSVINQGTITGGGGGNSGGGGGGGIGGAGVAVTGGSVTNTGTIIGGVAGQGSGTVANGIGGFGVNLIGGVVVNQGTITGGGGAGIRANYPSFSGYGVRVLGGTLVNAGVIGGGSGFNAGGTAVTADAVFFGGAARMIVDPGASFVGLVAANTELLDVMELASSGSAGTIAGLGTSITNFASLVFDAGARWTVAGNASAGGLGTLGIAGFAVGDTIDLTGFVAVSETVAGNQLVLTDSTTAHATLALQGSFASSNFHIVNGGSSDTDITLNLIYGQTIDDVGIIATSETVGAGVMTLRNSGSTVGTILVGDSLSTGDFTLARDSLTTGTNVIVHTATGSYGSSVTLTVNPSTIGSNATINVATFNGAGVYGPSGTPWVLTNQGHISETSGTKAAGVKFAGNGTIINAASATITSAGLGILLLTGGNVSNQSGGTISGGVSGIMELAAGAFTLVNNGYLAGHDPTTGRGVMAASPGVSITNQTSGTIQGHVAILTTGTSASVNNAGSIGAEPTTQIGIYLKAGGTITNAMSGAINGDTAIVASGTNTATVVNAGSIVGDPNAGFGISLNAGGLISNQSGGVISGYDGINAVALAATVVNAGSIGGNSISGAGVVLGFGGTITNQSTGTISGGAEAVTFAAGYTNRLVIDPGAVFTGTVDGGNTSGGASISTLELASDTSVGTLSGLGTKYIDFAQVTIDAAAAWTLSGTATGFTTLTNAGRLASGVTLGAGTFTISNQSSGTIAGPDGIHATGAASVVNAGSIDGNSGGGRGIYLEAGGSVINQPSGTITGYFNGIEIKGTAGVVANSGRIAGTTVAVVPTADGINGPGGTVSLRGVGVYLSSGGQVTNTTNGYIFGALIGVGLLTTGTVNNAGSIVGGTSGTTGYGVGLGDGGSVTNSATTSKILGASDGIFVTGTVGTVTNQGTIFGIQHYGINLLAGGSVTNSGTAAVLAGMDDGAVIKHGAGSVTNQGTIAGIHYVGIYLGSGGTITNSGTASFISGAIAGVVIGTGISGGIVTNAGTILAMGTAAVGAAFDDSASNTLINSGTITATGSAGVGLRFADGGNNTVIDSGTITGGVTADAVLFADGNDLLELEPGASFIGGVDGGAGTNVLKLGVGVGTLAGFNGVSITNFSSLVFDAGAAWTVSGNSLSGGLGALVINGFTSGDTIELTGFTAISETFAGNALVLTDRFASHATLHFDGTLGISNFAVSSGTLATEISFHQPTTITAGGTVGFSGGGSPVILDGGVTVVDPSGATLAGATIAISSGFLTGDTLSFTDQNGITGSFDNATGILTLTGTAPVLDYQAALASISYSLIPSNGDPTSAGADTSRTITWVVNDGTTVSNIGTSTLNTSFAPLLAYGQTIDETGIIANSETVIAGVMTLQNSATTVGTIAVGDSLSTGNFILRPNGIGTDIIVSAVSGSYASGVTLSVNAATIASTAEIIGTLNNATGVYAQAGTAWALTNQGLISEGPAFNGSFTNSGFGISFAGSGTITNAASAAIYGYSAAIKLSGAAARVVNLGRVGKFGDSIGVNLANGGVVINGQAGGTVSPAYIGGYSISALFASSNVGRLTNYGTINGNPHGTAVQMVTGTVVNGPGGATAALIGNGSASGVLISGAGTVLNHGTVLGGGSFGQPQNYGVKLGGAGSIGNLGAASLIEGYIGVDAQSNATVTNAGTIASNYGPSGTALRFAGGTNRLIVDPGAVFSGTVSAAGTTTLELASPSAGGAISGLGAHYINFSAGTVDAGAQWSLTGDNTWTSGTTLTVSGSLSAAGTLRNHGAIVVESPLIVTGQFFNAGAVNATGGVAAVSVLSGGVADNIGIGVITGAVGTSLNVGAIGVAVASANPTNPAAIFSDGNGGDGGPGGTGVNVVSGSLTNHGTILGGVGGDGGINYGGAGGTGVDVTGSGVIINNQGTIIGGAGGTGSVSGTGGYGIRLQAGETLINAGLIGGGSGLNGTAPAVHLASASRLIVDLGASFQGAVAAAAVNDVLELTGSGAGKLAGLGSSITGFNTLVFDDGAQWTIAGNDLASGLGTLDIQGFTVSDTIDLVGFAATSETFAGNALVLSNASASATLHIQGAFNTSNFKIAPDLGTGTDISFLNAPSLIAGGTVTFTGGGLPVALDSGLLVTDQASATLIGATVSIASGFSAGDTLNFAPQFGITGNYDSATGLLTLTGSATLAQYQTALASISFSVSPANGDPTGGGGDTARAIHWLVNDGAAVSNTGTSALTTVHVGPSITAGGTVTYAAGAAAAVLDPTVTVADPDSADKLTGGTVAVTGGLFTNDGGVLSAVVTGTAIAFAYNAATEVLTLSGTDTLADYQAVLRSVTFSSTTPDPTNAGANPVRTISWTVDDGVTVASAASSSLDVTLQPPAISGSVAGQATNDATALDPFAAVAVTDPNPGQTETVTITLSNPANGTFSSLGSGTLSGGAYVVSGTTLAVSSAIQALVFTPTAHQVAPGGSVTTGFTIAATDSFGGSAMDSTTTVVTTALNDPPVIAGTVAGQTVNDNATDEPFSLATISDPDFAATETVTITLQASGLASDANGTLSGTGLTKTTIGTYKLATGAPAAVTTALEALVFTPMAHEVAPGGMVTTGMLLSVTDGIAGLPTTNSTTTVVTTAMPCFAAGTRIATPRGEVRVQDLCVGDLVLTISGRLQPVEWIGRRSLDCRRHAAPRQIRPIRIAPHAFGENRPKRALLLSPDHSVFVRDVLIPIKFLVNDTTIRQIDAASVTYYHLALPCHDVVLAEGLAAESYLETGGRSTFENNWAVVQIHPNFAPDEARAAVVWEAFGYAPLMGTNGQLDQVRARLAVQAVMLGYHADGMLSQRARRRKSGAMLTGAGEGIRTLNLNLGKRVLLRASLDIA